MAQEKASPPRTPQCALQIVPNVIDSANESPTSRLLLRRVRIGGEEGRFRSRDMSGELKRGISRDAKGRFKARRVSHNTRLADAVDPHAPVPPPPPSAPPTVNGYVGHPARCAVLFRSDASVAEGVPGRSRQAVASPARGRQHLPLADRPSWNGRLALQAWSLLAPRGRPAMVRGPARRPAPHCICVPLHAAAEPVLPVGLAASCGCALCLDCEVCAAPVCTIYTFLLAVVHREHNLLRGAW